MRLVKRDIRNIDECLKLNNIKYIDVRYELIDHLVSEYEAMENYSDLDSFLSERMAWCKEIARKKQKSIPWRLQKMVGKMFLTILKQPKTWLCVMLGVALFYVLSGQQFSLRTMRYILLSPLLACVMVQLYYMASIGFKSNWTNKFLSLTYLVNLFALPQLFMWGIGGWLPKELLNNYYFMAPYILIGTLVNNAAILVFLKRRTGILEEYRFIKDYMVYN